MSAPQPAQARTTARLWSLLEPPSYQFVPDKPTPCHGNHADPETWHNYRRPGRAIAICKTCPFIGRCGYNAVAAGATHGVWAGVQLPGVASAARHAAVAQKLLDQFDRRRRVELGNAPLPPDIAAIRQQPALLLEEAAMSLLDTKHARELDTQIRAQSAFVASGFETLLGLMKQAAVGQIHKALKRADGTQYRSITDYFNDAVKIRPKDASERRLMAEAMSDEGMSVRAIGNALGVSRETIRRDLNAEAATDTNVSVDTTAQTEADVTPTTNGVNGQPVTDPVITGINGKTYKRKPKDNKPKDTPPADTPTNRGQAKTLKRAYQAIAKAIGDLDAAFPHLDHVDADLDIELLRNLATAADRIGTLARNLGASSSAERSPVAEVVPLRRA
jgi:WhiB family transcriptional regulator, redox-sensing transcriptional regulator